MDKEIADGVRRANEAAITLLTLVIGGDHYAAADFATREPVYYESATAMALAVLAAAAMKSLAEICGSDPLEVVQIAALSAAQLSVDLETEEEGE